MEMPSSAVAEWLGLWLRGVIEPDLIQDVIDRSGRLTDPAWLDRVEQHWTELDDLVCELSVQADLEPMRAVIAHTRPDLVECLILRVLVICAQLAKSASTIRLPSPPDIRRTLRLMLIDDERRSGEGPTH